MDDITWRKMRNAKTKIDVLKLVKATNIVISKLRLNVLKYQGSALAQISNTQANRMESTMNFILREKIWRNLSNDDGKWKHDGLFGRSTKW